MNWKELKDFANSLDEEQLEKEVVLWREEEIIIKDINAELTSNNYYINPKEREEGIMPEYHVLTIIKENPDDYPNGLNDWELVYSSNQPILWEKF